MSKQVKSNDALDEFKAWLKANKKFAEDVKKELERDSDE